MRKTFLLLTGVYLSIIGFAQIGISTNPLNPVNPQVPSKANTFFNWMDSIYLYETDCKSPNAESPFFKTDNLEALRVSKDMLNKDGWELIRRNFGLTESNQPTVDNVCHSDYILYNRFTGILRIVMRICKTCRNEDYNAAKITLQFESGSQWKTDLLTFSRPDGLKSVDMPLGYAPKYAAGAEYFNDYEKWFYADFPMMYDPCTPNYESKLKIISELIATSTINIEGGITGDLYAKDEGGKGKIQKSGSYSWNDFNSDFGKIKKINASINDFRNSSQEFATQIGGLISDTTSAFVKFASELAKDKMLIAGLKAVPWLGTAVGIFEAFAGGGKASTGPQVVKMMPMTMNLTAKLSGTLTKTAPYHNIIFNTPGAKDNQLDLPIYPYYNEVLGVFNILKKPEIKYNYTQTIQTRTVCSRFCITYYDTIRNYAFTMANDQIKYVVNPATGLELQEMKVAIYFDRVKPPVRAFYDTKNGDFTFFGYDGMSTNEVWRADDFFAACANGKKPTIQLKKNGGMLWNKWEPQNAYVQFILNFKRLNCPPGDTCQNVLHVYKFPATLTRNTSLDVTPIVSNCQDTVPLPQETTLAVQTFCASAVYANDNIRSRSAEDDDQNNPPVLLDNGSVKIFPNPANSYFTVSYNQASELISSAVLINANGQVVQAFNSPIFSNSKLYINRSLPTGTYVLVLQTSRGKKSTKVTILR